MFIIPNYAYSEPIIIAAFGDSLMAGYGLSAEEGFVPTIQKHLDEKGVDVKVLNFAVSGNTTADGLTRVSEVIAAKPDVALLALGSNDFLRFIPPAAAKQNLSATIAQLQENNIEVLLVGSQASLNWGPHYKKQFDAIFFELATQYELELYPFFLEGIALDPVLNQSDGLHPNQQGVDMIVTNIAPFITDFITKLIQ